jgi:hypothetical protein
MPFRIPMILEKDNLLAIRDYNAFHALEHQDIANWLNALANAKSLGIAISYYTLPILDPHDKNSVQVFFSTNWKQHAIFYDVMNKIGNTLTPPVFTFPRNYPSEKWDMDIENLIALEHSIHLTLWRAIDILKG